jgi:hypothetical protein
MIAGVGILVDDGQPLLQFGKGRFADDQALRRKSIKTARSTTFLWGRGETSTPAFCASIRCTSEGRI